MTVAANTAVSRNIMPCSVVRTYIILPVVLYGCETWSLTLRVGTQAEGV